MESYDALVIGGGPGGATAATFLARKGRRILVLEKETFPRFHIGESLLPYNMPLLRELGLEKALEDADFVPKLGAQFLAASGQKCNAITFAEGVFTEEPQAIQVERSRFDKILLDQAEAKGAEVRQGWAVKDYQIEEGQVSVTARKVGSEEKTEETFTASYLIDASGNSNFTGNREQLKQLHPNLKKVAIFGHFTGVDLPDDSTAGDTLVARFDEAWFWLIPIGEKVSVGYVVDHTVLRESGGDTETLFNKALDACPRLHDMMRQAKRVGPLRHLADFSYSNSRLVSPRLIRIGDAAGFLDPIFSSGVFLAMLTGKNAATELDKAISKGQALSSGMRRYERQTWGYLKRYRELIEMFYERSFAELLVQPEPLLKLPCAINAFLAGRIMNDWQVRWRIRFFYWMVRFNRHRRIVEPVHFG